MVQNKKEKQKKGKKKSVLETYVDIQKHLSFAENVQRTIMQSSIGMKALAESAKSLQIKQVTDSLQAFSRIQKTLRQASFVYALQSSRVLKTLAPYQRSVQRLTQNYESINRMIQSIPKLPISKIPSVISTKIDNIPTQANNVVQSLLRHVDFLEREIAKKEKENKELRRILSELKKKLKTSYVV